jgi:acetyl-CoA carboxylase carboxyl transferase subunit beta
MNWIKNFVRPRIRSLLGTVKRDVPENMWIKDPDSGQMVFYKDLEANQFVFPGSNHHHRMPASLRLTTMFDGGEFEKISGPAVAADPLKFKDEKRYADRLKDAKSKTGVDDSIQAGYGQVNEQAMVVAVQDMGFIGGSLGMAAGDAIIAAMRMAVTKSCPFVIFVASGGARMQEGILSLMQLPRTTIAVQELREAGLPYIVVLTNPTTGGVTASYAMLGDVHLAEPQATIGFAGQRVIEQTIREKLPEGFQKSEYLREHGMVDSVVHRHEMKATVSRIARMLMKAPAREISAGALVAVNA